MSEEDRERQELAREVVERIIWAADPANQQSGMTLELGEVAALAGLLTAIISFRRSVSASGESA